MKTPVKPTINPRIVIQFGFALVRNDSNRTSQNGEVEIIKAAMPDGTVRSARATRPLPPSRRAVPTIAVDFQLLQVGRASPAIRLQVNRITPDMRKRMDACRNGGMVSTENRIARYVEPQTIYNASKAIQILVFIQILFCLSRVG
jgi:hypothetical protein